MRAESEAAFHDFVVGRSPGLLRTAFLLCGDRGHAEDLVQTTLAKAYLAWPRICRSDTVDAYVRRVMVNAHISNHRRHRLREQPVDRLSAGLTPDAAEVIAERDRLRTALVQLPARQRAAVVLRHYEDLSEAVTAETLGCSTGTVKSLTSRGLARLRVLLSASPGPGGPAPVVRGPAVSAGDLR